MKKSSSKLKFKLYCLFLLTTILFSSLGCSIFGTRDSTAEDYLARGDAFYGEGNYTEALNHYLKAAELEPENPEVYYKIGLLYGTLHSLEGADRSLIGGKTNQLSRRTYRDDSHFNNALHYFRKAANLEHVPSREILRAMYENIQHRDVQY